MDRGHLRTDDGVILSHFLGKLHFFDGRGADGAFLLFLFSDTQGGEQGADSNSGCSQVIDFVNFQAGINLVGAGENVVYLIGGNGIQSAAEGV